MPGRAALPVTAPTYRLSRGDPAEAPQCHRAGQRSYGVSRAVVQQAEERDLAQRYRWSATPSGRRKLRRALRESLPREYRAVS